MSAVMLRELHARTWAKRLYDCDFLLCDLSRGDLFSFPNSALVHVYLGRGWYKSKHNVKASRVGVRTAIVKHKKGVTTDE